GTGRLRPIPSSLRRSVKHRRRRGRSARTHRERLTGTRRTGVVRVTRIARLQALAASRQRPLLIRNRHATRLVHAHRATIATTAIAVPLHEERLCHRPASPEAIALPLHDALPI